MEMIYTNIFFRANGTHQLRLVVILGKSR